MTLHTFLWATGCAFVFSLWPLAGKISGLHPAWIAVYVLIGSLVGGGVPSLLKATSVEGPTVPLALLFLGLGALNGLGMYFYPIKLGDPSVAAGPYVVTVMVGIVLISLILSSLLFSEVPSLRQFVGAAAIVFGIWLLAG